jgi:hypothetical protein
VYLEVYTRRFNDASRKFICAKGPTARKAIEGKS